MQHLFFEKINFEDAIQVQEYRLMCEALYNEGATQHPLNTEHINRTLKAFEERTYLGEIVVFFVKNYNPVENQVVGYASLANFWSNEWGGNILHIDEIFVKADFRRKGITHIFFEWLDENYKNKNLAQAYALEVSPENPQAQKLYEKLGFYKKYYNYMIK